MVTVISGEEAETLLALLAKLVSLEPVARGKQGLYGKCIYCNRPVVKVSAAFRNRYGARAEELTAHADTCLWVAIRLFMDRHQKGG